MGQSMENNSLKAILDELEALKKLMVLNMLEKGYSQSQIALTLGVGQATVSRMFPAGVLKSRAIKRSKVAAKAGDESDS